MKSKLIKTSSSDPCLFSSFISYHFLSLLHAPEIGITCSPLTSSSCISLSYLPTHIYFPLCLDASYRLLHCAHRAPAWEPFCPGILPLWDGQMSLRVLVTYHVLPHPSAFHTLVSQSLPLNWGSECDEFMVSPTSCGSVETDVVALPSSPTRTLTQFSVFPRRLHRELDWHHHCRRWAQKPKTSWWQRGRQCPLASETVSTQAPIKKYFMWREGKWFSGLYISGLSQIH